ncbi:hypothetical protein [Sphingopyxis sp. USTB-05]|uniref:hypothetical protein n=1 Tax=Sphingopyxis sp. USTB-05 TaxID=2830667 RepID=UPI002079189D|nr:hypothetical protein [Sphingopyxis sp. USTB-05]USI76523.1 hypothetical protein KEC45_17465 [Sphingopyxis sp. USTB-05]
MGGDYGSQANLNKLIHIGASANARLRAENSRAIAIGNNNEYIRGTMTGLLLTLFVIGMSYLAARLINALRHVLAGGVDQTEEFLRSGVTFSGLWKGDVPEQESGSLITVREGIRLSTKKGKVKLVPTSTISRDLY